MPELISSPPISMIEPVTEILHGAAVTDPYRWLEDQDSPRTRRWIEEQTQFARAYLDQLPGRERIRRRIREFLAVETYDSLQKAGNRYFFRKRLADQEQPCICMREQPEGEDHLLVDPAEHGPGKHTAVKPLRVSPDGRLLLFEVKEGGERTGTFKLLDIESKRTLPDVLPRGYLRGFAFAPDGKSFCYVHEPADARAPIRCAAFRHHLGTDFSEDLGIFVARGGENYGFLLSRTRTGSASLSTASKRKYARISTSNPGKAKPLPSTSSETGNTVSGPFSFAAESSPSRTATRQICALWSCASGPAPIPNGWISFPRATAESCSGPCSVTSSSLSPPKPWTGKSGRTISRGI